MHAKAREKVGQVFVGAYVSPDVHAKLIKVQSKLQLERGRKVHFQEIIAEAINSLERDNVQN